jgi:hypothetical protein
MPCKIRLDCPFIKPNIDIVEFILKFTDTPENALIVKEHNPKEHIHVYLENNVTVRTLRTKINEMLTDTTNKGQRSVSENHTDWEGYKGYLLKYPNTDVLFIGDDLDEEELREYYHSVSKGSSKVKKYTEIAKIEQIIQPANTLHNTINAVIDYYIQEKKAMNKSHMVQQATTIWYSRNPQNRHNLLLSIATEMELDYLIMRERLTQPRHPHNDYSPQLRCLKAEVQDELLNRHSV